MSYERTECPRSLPPLNRVKVNPPAIFDGNGHTVALATVLAAFGKHARYAIGQAADLPDADSADLFTEISRGTDSWRWLVEAHLQAAQ